MKVAPKSRAAKRHENRHRKLYNSWRWRNPRGYVRRWLRKHPLCRMCDDAGLSKPATEVDHIRPHRGDEQLFWDEANWQPLCHACHAAKTAAGR